MFQWLRRKRAPAASRYSEEERTNLIRRVEAALRDGDVDRAEAELAPLQADRIVHPYAFHLAGIIASQRRDLPEAVRQLTEAARLDPTLQSTWRSLVDLRLELGDASGAVNAIRGLLALVPGDRSMQGRLVLALSWSGDHDAAVEAYQMHRLLDWHFDLRANPAAILHAQGHIAPAADLLRSRIAEQPHDATLWLHLGCTRQAQGHLDTAIACYREALKGDPELVAAHRKLAFALDSIGELEDAIGHYQRAAELLPRDPQVYSDYLAAHTYVGWRDVTAAALAYREYDRRFGRAPSAPTVAGERNPVRKLKIGYVSGDFCEHAINHFLEPVLAHHDRDAVQVWCYDRTMQRDLTSGRLESLADGWRLVAGQDWDTLAQTIRDDGIDILVDLKGHFDDNQLPLFARKPAPVQVTWLGYPDTTGLSAMDAWLTDSTIAEDLQDQYASESIVPVGPFFMSFRPKPDAPDPGPLPASTSGHITFGCFNSYSKVSERMRDAIVAILRRIPDSRCLFTAVPRGNARTRLLEHFERQGIDPQRVEIRGRGGHDEFLRCHQAVDITLDSFPYNGTTTALHSLWMGVPFVALVGRTHVSRVGYSILANLGLHDWIARDAIDYVDVAVARASDIAGLDVLRQTLRQRVASSVIMDGVGFTRRLEQVYRRLAGGNAAPVDGEAT